MSPALSSVTTSRRFLFFGGKGGAGKTTCAAATAVWLARQASVLALSLDPAHSLWDVLGHEQATSVDVLELDARAEFADFMRQHRAELGTIADRGTYLDEDDIQGFLDLTLPGLDEIMGLLKLGQLSAAATYAHVVVDLPPTGHAMRLFDVSEAFDRLVEALDLMQDKHRFAVGTLTRRYVPDQMDAFIDELRRDCEAARQTLLSAERSAIILVVRPEPLILAETVRYAERLRSMSAPLAGLILNGAADEPLPAELSSLELARIPRMSRPPVGVDSLRAVAEALEGGAPAARPREAEAGTNDRPPDLQRIPGSALPDSNLAPLLEGRARLLIFGGKGGTGKTTMAAASAIGLARRAPERSVVVMSIDPAHSLADSLAGATLPNLTAVELQLEQHWQEWTVHGQELFHGLLGGTRWDPVYDREIAQQLGTIQPTGLDELQAATSVIDLLDEDPARVVIVDTAPTGHLIRFLESPGLVIAWSRELMHILLKYKLASQLKPLSEELLSLSRKTKRLQALLCDPALCELVVVALAEPAVVAETKRLIDKLRELKVPVRHVILNQLESRAGSQELVEQLRQRFPELRFIEVARRPVPVQGLSSLEALCA